MEILYPSRERGLRIHQIRYAEVSPFPDIFSDLAVRIVYGYVAFSHQAADYMSVEAVGYDKLSLR